MYRLLSLLNCRIELVHVVHEHQCCNWYKLGLDIGWAWLGLDLVTGYDLENWKPNGLDSGEALAVMWSWPLEVLDRSQKRIWLELDLATRTGSRMPHTLHSWGQT